MQSARHKSGCPCPCFIQEILYISGIVVLGEINGDSFYLRRRRWRSGRSELTLHVGGSDMTAQSAADTQREVSACQSQRRDSFDDFSLGGHANHTLFHAMCICSLNHFLGVDSKLGVSSCTYHPMGPMDCYGRQKLTFQCVTLSTLMSRVSNFRPNAHLRKAYCCAGVCAMLRFPCTTQALLTLLSPLDIWIAATAAARSKQRILSKAAENLELVAAVRWVSTDY